MYEAANVLFNVAVHNCGEIVNIIVCCCIHFEEGIVPMKMALGYQSIRNLQGLSPCYPLARCIHMHNLAQINSKSIELVACTTTL